MKPPTLVPVKNLTDDRYPSVVCYPKADSAEIQNRISELEALGVEAVEFSGKAEAFHIPVLGKGYVGIVVAAFLHGEKVALKMRRTDADRQTLEWEAKLLAKANSVNVGPKLFGVSKNFLVMQLVDGDLIGDWLELRPDAGVVKRILRDILEQCWRLDEAGLDHGELSKAPKHLLVGKGDVPFIVDFETASTTRKVANVNAVCQHLFVGNSNTAKIISEILQLPSREKIIAVLKNYKKNMTRQNFEQILSFCS
ncbi:MAG: serine/threonine protein kinase [Candidatus Bathyarchaeota archaeon]|nr:serine/threonine protein kinase [Candidatus Bathyarchaeota archaeon]